MMTCSGNIYTTYVVLCTALTTVLTFAQTLMNVLLTLMAATKAAPTQLDHLCVLATVDTHSLVMEGLVWI